MGKPQILLLVTGAEVGEFEAWLKRHDNYRRQEPGLLWCDRLEMLPQLLPLASLVIVTMVPSLQSVHADKLNGEIVTGKKVLMYAPRQQWSLVHQQLLRISPEADERDAFGISDPNNRGAHYRDIVAHALSILPTLSDPPT